MLVSPQGEQRQRESKWKTKRGSDVAIADVTPGTPARRRCCPLTYVVARFSVCCCRGSPAALIHSNTGRRRWKVGRSTVRPSRRHRRAFVRPSTRSSARRPVRTRFARLCLLPVRTLWHRDHCSSSANGGGRCRLLTESTFLDRLLSTVVLRPNAPLVRCSCDVAC